MADPSFGAVSIGCQSVSLTVRLPLSPMLPAMPVEIRYAQTDQDVIHVHQYLCVVAGPTLPGPIDPQASATEVWRCATQDVVLMAMVGDRLVGTLGLVKPPFWWNPSLGFLANRFFFVLPGEK